MIAEGMQDLVPFPTRGRTFRHKRRVRITDTDDRGRVRLDAVARFLQDVAIEDVEETGWGAPEHLWFVRRIRVDVLAPPLEDRSVELVTWCSGLGTVAAGRRWSVTGDGGGRIEVDSVWIHLGPDQRPRRIEGFGVYAEAAGGRRVSARADLPAPPTGARRSMWPLRATDIDRHGHVNNAAYWQAVEHVLAAAGPDLRQPVRARLDFRVPLDLGDELLLSTSGDAGRLQLGFGTALGLKAVALVESLV